MTAPQDYFPALLARISGPEAASARALLAQAAAEHPRDARPLLLLAAEHVHAKEIDLAEATYIAALQRAPDFAIARFQLGLLQLTSARPAAASATWAPLDALPPTEPLRLFKTGLELLAQDRFDEARRLLLEGIAQNRTNPALNRDMQLVITRIDQRDAAGASPAAPAAAGAQDAAPTSDHFLVSSYGKLQ
jgi:hypothetical protein